MQIEAVDDFDEKYENVVHPNETRFEKYKRKTKEFMEDLKDRAINNFEHLKSRFGYGNNGNNENNENQTEEVIKVEKMD